MKRLSRIIYRVWWRVPVLPGLFQDMNNGWSYDAKGNRIR
jgi:hypothetical protein